MKNIQNSALIQTESSVVSQNNGGISATTKRKIYQWHRFLGIITIIPVIFWTCSGIMHPFMAHWFKPTIPHEFIMPKAIGQSQIKLTIQEVMQKNDLSFLKNFRIITLQGQYYYQIKRTNGSLQYFSTVDGKLLVNGDKIYAESLARYFLEDKTSKIKNISLQTDFTDEYKYINRLLPVWKVSFVRADQMDVYIETEQSRLGTFNNIQRKVFLWIFSNFHNWEWLSNISNVYVRISTQIFFLSIIILSSLSGLFVYGFFWKKFKTKNNDKTGILRKYHRQIGISVAFVSLTFAMSGAYHASMKYTPDERMKYLYQPNIELEKMTKTANEISLDWPRVQNISVSKIEDSVYYQVAYLKTKKSKAEIAYFNAQTGLELKNGGEVHASSVSERFYLAALSGNPAACCELDVADEKSGEVPKIISASFIGNFDREYGFVNKRLPVVKVSFDTPNRLVYYIEPLTGRLSAQIVNADRMEGYSFAILHKYLFMDWAGKNVRDLVMLISAMGVLTVSLFGLALWLRVK